jgi:hypothetical protein
VGAAALGGASSVDAVGWAGVTGALGLAHAPSRISPRSSGQRGFVEGSGPGAMT